MSDDSVRGVMLRLQIMRTTYFKSSVSDGSVKGSSDLIQGGRGGYISSSCKASRFSELKTQIRQADTARSFPTLQLKVDRFDIALSGGLRFGHVHLITGRSFDGAATGFVLALLRFMMDQDTLSPVVWCSPSHAGHILASALPALGVSPSRFIFVHDQHPKRLMGAFEEVLQTRGVLAVVGEYGLFGRSADTWQRWVRRTRLAAKAGGTMGLLLGPPAPVSGFETGWHITTASADLFAEREGLQTDWRPYWSVQLTYSRQGTPCADKLVYDGLTGRLQSAISWPDKDGQVSQLHVSKPALLASISA